MPLSVHAVALSPERQKVHGIASENVANVNVVVGNVGGGGSVSRSSSSRGLSSHDRGVSLQ